MTASCLSARSALAYRMAITTTTGYASEAPVERRARFIAKTYNTLFISICAFAAIEVALFKSGLAESMAQVMLGGSWLIVMGAFLVVGWLASHVASRSESTAAQIAALSGYVLAEAIIFVPLLYIADAVAPGAIQSAALVTILGFAGLTAIVWQTKKDFSFLGGLLRWAGIMSLVLIGASLLFGFQLGTFFSVGMIAFAGAAILYDTSNVLRHYPEDRHISAALALLSSVALMFWYVLRLFIASRD
ncbi:MAG TPA: Bax inhibitor-1 family protein [Polyangiaceae bacterium]|nr:Bax inhibitor-1 family protein [Polyangiaceae bacterium]